MFKKLSKKSTRVREQDEEDTKDREGKKSDKAAVGDKRANESVTSNLESEIRGGPGQTDIIN